MNGSFEKKNALVLGGYGAVGSAVCEELASIIDGRIVVAGRDLRQAQRLALRLGERVEPAQLDAAELARHPEILNRTSVVVNCVEANNFEVAKQCFAHSAHYVDISATIEIIEQLQTLQSEAERANATAALSVGVAPGLTNLLARYAQSQLGPLAQVDLFVLLGLGEVHGEAAIQWTLRNLGRRFSILSDGIHKEVRPFGEGRSTRMPEPFGERTAYRFGFSDQRTLPATLGIKSAGSWLCFDSRLATGALWLLANSRLLSIIPLWRLSWLIAKLSRWFALGGAHFVVQADATSASGGKARFALIGEGEAQMTGIVAAHVVRRLLNGPAAPGILHIEQLLDLETLLPALDGRLRLAETSCSFT
ncbi:MAG TPA: saccharopine dehydrogenase NADP-binding domain-containing protein [Blastocatellia bacterium]